MTRKVTSVPAGTTGILWKKKFYAVGHEVPEDFPDDKLAVPAPVDADAGESAEGNAEDTESADGKKGKKSKK